MIASTPEKRRPMIGRGRNLAWVYLLLFGLPLAAMASGQQTHAFCSRLLTSMRQNHIPDVAVASFANRKVHMHYCTTGVVPLRPNAVFEAASLSKTVFAAAVLTLVQQGKLDLDRPLASYAPGPYRHLQNPFGAGSAYDIVTDPRLDRVTTRMVLSHTTGLPNWARDRPLTFVAEPGQKWSYSGEGYIYLQHVVEVLTGEPMQSLVQKTVFAPLGMTHSSFVWRPEFGAALLPPHAADGSTTQHPSHYGRALASSTLYTTLGDYARIVKALLYPKPGSVFTLEETQQVEVDPAIKLGWGLGIAIEDMPRKAYFHWGANPGYQSFYMVQPDTGRGVLVLTDSDNGLDLLDPVIQRFLPGKHPILGFRMLHPSD